MHSYYMKELCRFESRGKCAGKLVGTAGTLAATVDTSQASNGIGHLHTLAQGTDSKQIALAAAFERYTADYVGFKDNVDCTEHTARQVATAILRIVPSVRSLNIFTSYMSIVMQK